MHHITIATEFISKGGFMMAPLLISGGIAFTVIIERIFVLTRKYATSANLIQETFQWIQEGDFQKIKKKYHSLKTPIASIFLSAMEHFNDPIEEMELSMKNQAEAWIPLLEKRLELIDTVITAAPLMGLLGTITGMMASFEILSEKGMNESNAITGGIAEALIATATGLVIALICLVAYNQLTAKIKEFIYALESIASRLVEIRLGSERKK